MDSLMPSAHSVGAEGERLVAEFLEGQGRSVARSDSATFDLIVDGQYAEVKATAGPFSALGFIGLTQNQYDALTSGIEFLLFIVCNVTRPSQLEVIEIPAASLRLLEPTVESTYYFYRSQLEHASGTGVTPS